MKTGCPMHSLTTGDLTYNDYLKIPSLLSLQKPLSSPAHHDELLFIIIHQAYELWFKLVLHEIENALQYMQKQEVLRAHHFLNRTVQIFKLLVQQIHILETMTPVEFLGFRDNLMPASGFQSTQFREIEYIAGLKDDSFLAYFKDRPDLMAQLQKRLSEPDLWSAFCDLLKTKGFAISSHLDDSVVEALVPLYQFPEKHLELYLLSEALVEFDEYLGLWREHHVRVVERVIGTKPGTGGSKGVEYLQSTTYKKCFPFLWQVRACLKKN